MPEVAAEKAKELIGAGAQVIDVRTAVEHAAGRIPGSRHIPLSEIPSVAPELERERPVVLYCRVGNRSGPAADAFMASGWDAHSIEGGLVAWAEAGYELDPAGGVVGESPNMPPR